MKITKSQLKQLIKEELLREMDEQEANNLYELYKDGAELSSTAPDPDNPEELRYMKGHALENIKMLNFDIRSADTPEEVAAAIDETRKLIVIVNQEYIKDSSTDLYRALDEADERLKSLKGYEIIEQIIEGWATGSRDYEEMAYGDEY
jgi:hypothetical protein